MDHYDTLPYEGIPFPDTHPVSLNMLGRLFGIDSAPPSGCRVLELGCATGGNVIPMAWHLRDSEFVGVDLSHQQIATGKTIADELSLHNIRLLRGGIQALGDDVGEFDYIIAHSVLSWVPSSVQKTLFRVFKTHLKSNGVGYISFNVRPGWHGRSAIREMLLHHTKDITEPARKLEAATAFIETLKTVYRSSESAQAASLLSELQSLADAHPSYLFHEYLETNNHAFSFTEFNTHLVDNDLRYLCDARLHTMFGNTVGDLSDAFLEQIDDDIAHEQYLDFFNQRTFRQSLVVHAHIEPQYEIDLDCLDGLYCASDLVPNEVDDDGTFNFNTADGKQVVVHDTTAATMLYMLDRRYPDTAPLHELWLAARQESTQSGVAKTDDEWRAEFFNLFANNLMVLSTGGYTKAGDAGLKPTTGRLATVLLRHGWRHIPTVWHQSLEIDGFARRLLAHANGESDPQELVEHLLCDIKEGALPAPNGPYDQQGLRDLVFANVSRLLTLFFRNRIMEIR